MNDLYLYIQYMLLWSCFVTVADFQKLQEAKEVLCDETKRKNYDLWKRSGIAMTFHDWQALKGSVKTVCDIYSVEFSFDVFILNIMSCHSLFVVNALGHEK